LAEEVDKLQNGSKESTPDVCPEYRNFSSSSSSSVTSSEGLDQEVEGVSGLTPNVSDGQNVEGPLAPQGATSPRLDRRQSAIESSTDTLVPEVERNKDSGLDMNNGRQENLVLPPPLLQESPNSNGATNENRLLEESMGTSSCSQSSLDPLDSDGLVAHNDQVQRRMVEIFNQHRAELSALRRDLVISRLALTQAGIVPAELTSGVEEEGGNSEARSGVESTNSEVSWEAVEEGETRPTLWVPDHAASQCMGCHTQFWFGRRKHHCRSCGLLFCSECSEQAVPLPSEQLYQPVRVCDQCYVDLSGQPLPPRSVPSPEVTTDITSGDSCKEDLDIETDRINQGATQLQVK